MDRAELYDVWERGGKDRPQFVREYRDTIVEHVTDGVVDDLPGPEGSTHAYRQFLNSHAHVVTRQLNPENDDSETYYADTGDGDDGDATEVTA